MQIVECSACGSKELQLSEGMLICIYCRSRHLPDASTGGNFEVFEKKTGLEVVLEDGGKHRKESYKYFQHDSEKGCSK